MTTLSAEIKIVADIRWDNLADSRVKLQAFRNNKWVPLFEIKAKDFGKAFKIKRSKK